VFTEGISTEVIYLTHWKRLYRGTTVVTVADVHGVPMSLVKAASDQKRADSRDARKGRGDAFDHYWCVFDVNSHPNLESALDMAASNDIQIALSNPCLELWFLLHFEDQTAWIDRHTAQSRCRGLLGCGKTLTATALSQLEAGHDSAVIRAKANSERHVGNGTHELDNPSSSVWRLIETIRAN
jgi:hypothetical protein